MTLLYCDFDGPLPPRIQERVQMLCRLWQWPIEAIRLDRTRRGWHVVVAVRKRIAAPYIVAAQAIIGSDPMREAFNLMRVRKLRSCKTKYPWNVLYETHRRGIVL